LQGGAHRARSMFPVQKKKKKVISRRGNLERREKAVSAEDHTACQFPVKEGCAVLREGKKTKNDRRFGKGRDPGGRGIF